MPNVNEVEDDKIVAELLCYSKRLKSERWEINAFGRKKKR